MVKIQKKKTANYIVKRLVDFAPLGDFEEFPKVNAVMWLRGEVHGKTTNFTPVATLRRLHGQIRPSRRWRKTGPSEATQQGRTTRRRPKTGKRTKNTRKKEPSSEVQEQPRKRTKKLKNQPNPEYFKVHRLKFDRIAVEWQEIRSREEIRRQPSLYGNFFYHGHPASTRESGQTLACVLQSPRLLVDFGGVLGVFSVALCRLSLVVCSSWSTSFSPSGTLFSLCRSSLLLLQGLFCTFVDFEN